MRRKTLIIILAVFIVGAGAGGGLFFNWIYSPRYSLHQMVMALKAKNMVDFINYLDLKEIFNNFLEASSTDLPPPSSQEGDEMARLTRNLGRKFARFVLPQLFKTYEKDIQATMEKYMVSLDNKQVLALTAAIAVAQIKVEGDEAQVSIRDPKTKEDFRFQMRRQEDGVWRVVEVNYQDIKKFIKREFGD